MGVGWHGHAARRIDAQLRLRLAQGTFRPLKREIQLDRVQMDQLLSDFDFMANFNQHIPNDSGDFAADASLIRRYQCSGEVRGALKRDALKRRCADVYDRSALSPSSATLPESLLILWSALLGTS